MENGYHKSLTLCPSRHPLRAPRALAFHFPCTGDEGFEYRRDQVALNLLDRGIPQFYR